jgi:hypothetical protein
MESYRRNFQPPTDEELSLYDPATAHGASGPDRTAHGASGTDGMSSRDIPRR